MIGVRQPHGERHGFREPGVLLLLNNSHQANSNFIKNAIVLKVI